MSFEDERKALFEVMTAEVNKIEREYVPKPGHDDTVSRLTRPIRRKFDADLRQLHQKYGKEMPPTLDMGLAEHQKLFEGLLDDID